MIAHWRSANPASCAAFSAASCTRFSPKIRTPAAYASLINSGPWVLVTGISRTSLGSRPTLRQASSTLARTLARFSATPMLSRLGPTGSEGDHAESREDREAQTEAGVACGHFPVDFLLANRAADVLVHLLELARRRGSVGLAARNLGDLGEFGFVHRHRLLPAADLDVTLRGAVGDRVDRHALLLGRLGRLIRGAPDLRLSIAEQHHPGGDDSLWIVGIRWHLGQGGKRGEDPFANSGGAVGAEVRNGGRDGAPVKRRRHNRRGCAGKGDQRDVELGWQGCDEVLRRGLSRLQP